MVKPRENRIHMMLSEQELTAIDDWRFKNRIATRAEAIRRLCQIGLLFDEHRMEVMKAYVDIQAAASKNMDIVGSLIQQKHGAITPSEAEMGMAASDTLTSVVKLFPLLRSIVGISKNLKGDGELEKVFSEARELMAIFENTHRNLKLRNNE